ncbi:MAG: type II toxin-antitoxin system prevent-host-death family antitoxin [Patescibacteria group bacterium]
MEQKMLQVSSKQIIPTSTARKNFKEIVSRARGDYYFLITRTGEPAVVVADVRYFESMLAKASSRKQ